MSRRRTRTPRPLARVLLVPIFLAAASCGPAEPPPALAVGEVGYSALDLELLSPDQQERLIDLTAFGLAFARGELKRLGAPMIEREERTLLLQKLSAEIAARSTGLDDEALREAYHAQPDWELDVRHIVLLSERWRPQAERDETRARAEAILERVRAGEDFAALAAELSEEPGADRRGGLLSPGREGTWVREFWEAASALEVGEVSDVVETEYGFHVLKLEGRRPVPFDEVRNRVLGRLVDLVAAAGRADAWAREQASLLRIHVDAIEPWREGAIADTVVLASWPGGEYRGDAFRRYLFTLDANAFRRIQSADERIVRDLLHRAARDALLTHKATEMGIELDLAEAGSVTERWLRQANAWAEALGFRAGMTPAEVGAAAQAALAARGQGAQIARSEVLEIAPALRRLYPVRRAEPVGDAEPDADR